MNKLLKYAFWLITALAISFNSFTNAETIDNSNWYAEFHYNRNSAWTYDYSPNEPWMSCIMFDNQYPNASLYDWTNTYTTELNNRNLVCTNSDTVQLTISNSQNYYNFYFSDENWLRVLFPNFTSLQCQTEYNLIPISEVTANYCRLNFDLISPLECPSWWWSGTGEVNRSAWYINNQQYPWTATLQIRIPEFIKYSVTYNTDETQVDIEWYNADEDYINAVIDNERLTPTNEDFAYLISWLQVFIPYIFIWILILFAVKVFGKVWK